VAARIDITGQVFGRLTAISFSRKPKGRKFSIVWLCRCECGGETTATVDLLRGGHVRSCGCYQREVAARANTEHGGHGTRLYRIWKNVVQRCTYPGFRDFHLYGGRGIKVCDRWRHSFAAFREDMGEPPTPKHSIDRIDNDGHYEPGNCRWATRREQNNNTRKNHFVTYAGETLTLSEWSRRTGIRAGLLHARITRPGWPAGRALSEPPNPKRQAAKLPARDPQKES